ncbi:hypothetical protein GCM10009764_17570 [Nocardia ninae]|uniref:Uncharacterized protein n=1 Tax=Nocardia ninae NBRC 108245 TaxID=1210091 RepID=A0A511MBV3_9NOCA|nr:hypothetical protein NN4_17550 [Nocardia ninae NBRC 108245]
MLERLPGDAHRDPLLRIHRDRFPWRDAEEQRVEFRCTGKKPTGITDIAPAFDISERENFRYRPFPIARKSSYQFTGLDKYFPQRGQGIDTARRLYCHSDDDDRIIRARGTHHVLRSTARRSRW